MIGYEKLKLAHELCKKTNIWFFTVEFGNDDDLDFKLSNSNLIDSEFIFHNIDDLIAKLTELTQPEKPKPRYEVGQEVFFLIRDHIQQETIEGIKSHIEDQEQWYRLKGGFAAESELYPTREDLIKAQIEYWSRLFNESIEQQKVDCGEAIRKHHELIDDDCQHESERLTPLIGGGFKCKKCGEFYR